MIDICKCEAKDCPLKEKCYRYTSKPDHIQAYSDFSDNIKLVSPSTIEDNGEFKIECEYQIPLKE